VACCDLHDRLDRKLHTLEYLSMACGSLKTVCTNTNGVLNPTGELKKDYCCFDCPTLRSDQQSHSEPLRQAQADQQG
jgi:hypothetical protein